MGTTVQRNLYSGSQNINNAFVNIDDNRIENDQSIISMNYTTSPATVTIEAGSIFEINGNSYTVTVDEVFQMSNATHNYITFDGTTYGSAATIGTFNPLKQGYYQADNVTRTLRWFIDQDHEISYLNYSMASIDEHHYFNQSIKCDVYNVHADVSSLDAADRASVGTNEGAIFYVYKPTTLLVRFDHVTGTTSEGTVYIRMAESSAASAFFNVYALAAINTWTGGPLNPGIYRTALEMRVDGGSIGMSTRIFGAYGEPTTPNTDRVWELA